MAGTHDGCSVDLPSREDEGAGTAAERHCLCDVAALGIDAADPPFLAVCKPHRVIVGGNSRRTRPTDTVARTESVAGSIRDTVPSRVLATQTLPDPIATAVGPFPTGIAWTTSLDAGSMRSSVPEFSLATHTPPTPTAIPAGPGPTGIVFVTEPLPRSNLETVPSISFTTHTASLPNATAPGEFPTGIFCTSGLRCP
jgi:hypothetical protein